MTIPRRSLIRRPTTTPAPDSHRQRRLHKLRSRLETERQALGRWMSKLKRSFHQFEKLQANIARIELQISHLEDT